jgi:hypothetical protein
VTRAAAAAAVVVAMIVGAAGCKKREAPAATRPAPIGEPERHRGADACKDYIARACACATAHPDRADVAKRCQLDAALPDAMNLALGLDDEPDQAVEDVSRAQDQVRKIIATCVEGGSWLSAHGCP